jgi:hypothetical protein
MSEITAPNWLKPLAWAALIWNLLGVIAFVMQLLLTPEAMSELPIEQQTAYANIPLWSTIAFAIAVFGGTLGCVLLLTKQALAIPTFSLSLGAILLQQYYNFIVINSVKLLGASSVLMPLLVVAIALLLLYISIKGKQAGWLN